MIARHALPRLLLDGGAADQPRSATSVFGWRSIGRALDRAFSPPA